MQLIIDGGALHSVTDSDSLLSVGAGVFAVAAGPDRLTFAWIDGWSEHRLVIAQSTLDGRQLLGEPYVVEGERTAFALDLAWNGGEYVLAWSCTIPGQASPTIRAMRFDGAGRPLDAAPFDVSAPGARREPPSIAVTANGVEIAYSRIDEQNGGAPRAYVRTLDRLLPSPLMRRRPAVRH